MTYVSGKRMGALVGLALAATLALAACGTAAGGGAYGGSTSTNTTSPSTQVNLTCAAGATVCTKSVMVSGQAKTVLATTAGMTLYYFTPDSATTSACASACAQTWPPLTTTGSSVTGSGFSGTLSTLNDANGDQVLYNGHPLYTYASDSAQTDAHGEGVGGKWYVAFPGMPASTSSSGNRYGY